MKTTPPTTKHIAHNLTPDDKRRISFEICDRIARGELLSEISREDGMPHPDTFRNWCNADPAIASAWSDSQDDRIELLMRDLLKIVDEEMPTYKDARGNIRMDPAAGARMRLRVNSRRWLITLLTSHRSRASQPAECGESDSSPQRTPPARPSQPVGHPLDNPQAPVLPISASLDVKRGSTGKLPDPSLKTAFQLFANLKGGEKVAQGNPIPLNGSIIPSSKHLVSMPKISPSPL